MLLLRPLNVLQCANRHETDNCSTLAELKKMQDYRSLVKKMVSSAPVNHKNFSLIMVIHECYLKEELVLSGSRSLLT